MQRDSAILDEGIREMVAEIVNMSIVDYMNAIIFFNKNKKASPSSNQAIERKRTMRDCEVFFQNDYECMTGRDGEKAMKHYETLAAKRDSYVNRKWSRSENGGVS